MTRSTTARDLRRLNRQLVLQRIYFAGPISRLALSQQLGLSPATVTHIVAELVAEEIVVESGVAQSQGGRPRTNLLVNPAHACLLGVDVGETAIQVELFDLLLQKLGTQRYALAPQQNSPAIVAQQIVLGVKALLESSGEAPERVLGVGIGVPGIVQHSGEGAVFAPHWGWHNVPLQQMLGEQIALPLLIDNGAKAMALAELLFGAGRSAENLAVLLLGTGVGAGIIAQGQLYRGITNSAGEWGHTPLVLEGRQCRCGRRGCLEAYVGALGIIQTLRELAPDSPLLAPGDQVRTLVALVDAAAQGDPVALRVLQKTAHYLGAGVANVINLFNPQKIVLGGWVGLLLGPAMLAELYTVVERYALSPAFEAVSLGLCELGPDAICEGAATLVLNAFLASGGRPDQRPLQRDA